MPAVTDRQTFKDYCLRRLGFPVIDINVDEDQIEDRIDDALQYWQDYHFDGLQKFYYVKAITQSDIDQKYIDLSNVQDSSNNKLDIVGISRIFPIQDSQASISMFDLRYQLRLNELYDFTSASYVNYTLTLQHLRSLELMFSGEVPIRFQRHMQKLYIDWAWGSSQAPKIVRRRLDPVSVYCGYQRQYLPHHVHVDDVTLGPDYVKENKLNKQVMNMLNINGAAIFITTVKII